ncbi:MAG: Calx-beta domain-containing protein [Vicinamibacteria bacterium]
MSTLRARTCASFALCLLLPLSARAQLAVFAHIDGEGDVGRQSAIAFGSDGLALIAYYDATNRDLKIAHCLTADCTSSTRTVLDSTGDVGSALALAIGADGLGVVAYLDATLGTVKVAHCTDAACSAASIATVGTGVSPYQGIAIVTGTDGLPLIVYNAANFRAASVHCLDAACSSTSVTVLNVGGGSRSASLSIGGDGLPLLALGDGFGVSASKCVDLACTSVDYLASLSGTFPPPPGTFGTARRWDFPAIVLGSDGRPNLVVALQIQDFVPIATAIRYTTVALRCGNAACSYFTGPTIANEVVEPAVALSPTGRPLVAQRRQPYATAQSYLTVTRCLDPDCQSAETELVGGPGIGRRSSIAVGPDGFATIAFYNENDGDLLTAYMRGWGTVDLSLTISDAPDPVLPGDTLRYEFRAANAGGALATGLRLHAALPPGTVFLSSPVGDCVYAPAAHAVDCAPGSLAAGANAVLARAEVRVPAAEPGALTISADIQANEVDFAPSNNSATVQTVLGRWMAVEPAVVTEGDTGKAAAAFRVVLHDTVPAGPPATATFATGGGNATPGADYLAAAGVVTFPPGAPVQTVEVAIVGDALVERDEWFGLQVANPHGAGIVAGDVSGTIVDDDVAALPFAGELDHGAVRWADLAGTGTRSYRLAQAPQTSYELVVDAASGDVQPLELARLAADGSTVLQTGTAPGTGASVRLGWVNSAAVPSLTQLMRVRSGGCRSGCAADDVYRIRVYDTTVRVPRFNNSGSQVTLLVLQNPSDRPIGGRAWFWNASGGPVASVSVSLASRETVVLNTSAVAPGASGAISIAHDGGYGAIVGKSVALEPATGLAFDTPLEVRPR